MRTRETRPTDDTRSTLRLDDNLDKLVKKSGELHNRSKNGEIEYLLKVALGYKGIHPAIVKSDQIYIVSPIGTYGIANSNTFRRFIAGSIPIGDQRWDSAFDTYDEAIDSIGEIVCEFTDIGLIVVDVKEFVKIYAQLLGKK